MNERSLSASSKVQLYSSWGQTLLHDDGFGNLLEACGSWYFDHPEESAPEGMIRANPFRHQYWADDRWDQFDPKDGFDIRALMEMWAKQYEIQRAKERKSLRELELSIERRADGL